jgi:hypothetical protein
MDRAQWISESKGVAEDFRSILTTSTHFPRSGQVNLKVLDFVDLIVANWERGGYAESQEETGWIIEVRSLPMSLFVNHLRLPNRRCGGPLD